MTFDVDVDPDPDPELDKKLVLRLLHKSLVTLKALSVVIVRSLPPPAGGSTCLHLTTAGALSLSLEPVQSHEASKGPEVSP